MGYKIPDSMQKALKNIAYIIPEPKIETESQPDGSIKLAASWDTKDFASAVSAIVQQMNETFDDAIIEEFAASNGYVKKHTCRRLKSEIFNCSTCGSFLRINDVYCSHCGSEIEENNNE